MERWSRVGVTRTCKTVFSPTCINAVLAHGNIYQLKPCITYSSASSPANGTRRLWSHHGIRSLVKCSCNTISSTKTNPRKV